MVTKSALNGLFASLIMASLALSAHAATPAPRPLKACAVEWQPFIVIKDKQFSGIDTHILRDALTRIGFKDVQIDEVPWKRCLKLAEDGEYDIVFSASKNEEREKFLLFPKTPLHVLKYVFVVPAKVEEKWTSENKVSTLPQPIGIPLGYSLTDRLKAEKGVTVDDTSKNDETNINKMMLGRVGTILIESINAHFLLDKLKLTTEAKLLSPPYSDDKAYYITVSKKAKDAQAIVDALDSVLPKVLPLYEK